MAFRFVHAADVHLDSPLKSLALRNSHLVELVGNATRRAFTRIVDLCLRERVDALVLSGDLYDDNQTSMKTALFLASEVRRLHQAGVRTFVIRGNHDAIATITRELTLPTPSSSSTTRAVLSRSTASRADRASPYTASASRSPTPLRRCFLGIGRP